VYRYPLIPTEYAYTVTLAMPDTLGILSRDVSFITGFCMGCCLLPPALTLGGGGGGTMMTGALSSSTQSSHSTPSSSTGFSQRVQSNITA